MLRRCVLTEGRLQEAADGPIWIVTAPDEAERRQLVEGLALDEHTLNSSLDPDELSRFELEPEHAALILKRPKSYSKEDDFHFKEIGRAHV